MRQFPVIGARATGSRGAEAKAGSLVLPGGACDCHVHLFGPMERYPLSADRAYTPGLAEVADAQVLLSALDLQRLVLVQPSSYGFDNGCLLDGLAALGESARGVAVVRPDTPDEELADLHAAGVRGVRINLGGPQDDSPMLELTDALEHYGARLVGTDWLIQVHAPPAALVEARAVLLQTRQPVVIDHFANIPAATLPDHPARRTVETLLADTASYLKLSAPYRVARTADELSRLASWVLQLTALWPDRLLWGSDWPHTPPHGRYVDPRQSIGFREIDASADLATLLSWTGQGDARNKLLVHNPEKLFGF